MPELPEVETVARTLRPRLVGRKIRAVATSGLALRAPVDEAALASLAIGATVGAVRRIGKYLLFDLASPRAPSVIVAHLGMTGRFGFAAEDAAREPHTHVILRLDKSEELRYVDPRRFGVLRIYRAADAAAAPELAALGPDPLAPAFTVAYLRGALAESRGVAIKQFLLDQGRIAGLGNIYVSEALHVAGIGPRRPARALGRRSGALHAAIVEVLSSSVTRRGTTLRDYRDADGAGGGNQHHLLVYGREGDPCRRCGRAIRRIVQAARSTFYCPGCQR